MKDLTSNWLWAAVVFPVLIGFFKNEIGKIIKSWNIYRLRSFDLDGNPFTEDHLQILNSATGQWGDITIERYIFSMSSRTRGVYLRYPDGGREKVSFILWAGFRKRTAPKEVGCHNQDK